ncbi:MAG: UDP-N-acetylglucosamine 4,6-dehydratase (inverting) [Candidatus Omnitrophica bacterium CG_4_8_14_3_um_filter_43_15]|nr:MAG: UDP-N-acetylglucosamine 4,6-dehydratase (inverting) [Candidatus Omnitrophica bacterium CG1_02_43_210]PIV39588.1 MAG: UDP-N-acetylglucosamine 4,6-dehydratase (inverting) [Candidatus Omnitrophica bacterium CG02_land_8_20_14_3_00__42_8]PIW79819.1 MAG: UDP-N-acetylglucosamine 4,6-dehydratase (inverting) [Candidatus Omnitrophica bacterium CG_4_8_14_3_um_filter_43_15]
MLNGKTILVTGGTGSFGKKFTEIVLSKYKPKKLIIFSRDEMKQYEMKSVFIEEKYESIRYFIGDVRDSDRLHRAFNGVDIVIHAAALKIVPTAEYNPFEAVRTNVFGAENIINVAIDNNVKKVLALSTDKAVNPVNLYGATKLCAEKMFIAANNYSSLNGTKFSVVRYGNVFGSRGSVVPFFKACAQKGTVPITDKDMTRFWITLEQGVEFVLSSLEMMNGGEIFVPKIPSMKITDLANAICPGCKHKIIGIRPGEKLHESLLSPDDGIHSYEYKDRFIVYPKVVENGEKKKGKYLGLGFKGYTSDNNKQWLTEDRLKKMV